MALMMVVLPTPGPPVMTSTLDIRASRIDGTHRMAAFVMFQRLSDAQLAQMNVQRPSLEQDVWQGVHPNGEPPDW